MDHKINAPAETTAACGAKSGALKLSWREVNCGRCLKSLTKIQRKKPWYGYRVAG